MIDIDIEIQEDGCCLVPRGNKDVNDLVKNIVSALTDEDMSGFFDITDDSDLIFGEQGFCG